MLRPGRGQLRRRIHESEQDARTGVATLLTGLPHEKDRLHLRHRLEHRKIDRRTGIDHDDDLLDQGREHAEILDLMIREVVVALREVTVAALAGHAGNHVDRRLRILHIRVLDRTPLRHLEGVARIGIEEKLPVGAAAALVEDLLLPRLPRELIALLIILDPVLARHPHTCEREAVIDRHTVPHIHITGAGSTLDREPRTCTEQRHRNPGRKRQHPVVLQEDDALLRRLPREDAMPLLPLGDFLGCRSSSRKFIDFHILFSS